MEDALTQRMYGRILVPLDGSPLAERVLPYVRLLGKAWQVPIELLRVYSTVPEGWSGPGQGRRQEPFAAGISSEPEDYLDKVTTSLIDLGVPVTSAAYAGDPASLIVSSAEAQPGALIAMSTHGRSGITRWVLGSVTDKVLHATAIPMLVVRSQDENTPVNEVELASVVVPLDGSSLAEQVLPHVVALARSLDLTPVLVRVAPDNPARSRDYLHEVKDELHLQGVSSVEVLVLAGHPAEAIVDLARETPNCLVAMTTHGRSGIGRWLLGSVTDRVVRHSGAPVLVVRAAS
jgi:nucleotide-binding universal stress UspA family protein